MNTVACQFRTATRRSTWKRPARAATDGMEAVLQFQLLGRPMRKSERSSEIQLIGKSAAKRASGFDRHGTVLVVEDNELIRELEADVLRGMGYDVAAVANTDDALKLLGDPHIAILVTDIRLPGALGGIDLARTAKQRRPNLKVMVVGVDVDQFAPEDLAGIADECLAKPFTVDEFESRLRSAAGQRDAATAS